MRKATNVARENLVSIGTCIGKFTKTKRFRLHITALDFMAPYAKVRVLCLLKSLLSCVCGWFGVRKLLSNGFTKICKALSHGHSGEAVSASVFEMVNF